MMMESDQCSDEQETVMLFHSVSSSSGDAQSPSTFSHANSDLFHSRTAAANHLFSGYSSSRGSNNSFPNDKNIVYDPKQSESRLIIVKDVGDRGKEDENYDSDGEGYYGNKGGWWGRYLSVHEKGQGCSSWLWICVQISWRLMVSLAAALLVFYMLTKSPPPIISVKIAGIRPFELGEGVDSSGVATKILSCNCSMEVLIDNNSNLFGLHIAPPLIDMSFGHLPLSLSHGPKVYVESEGSRLLKMSVGSMKKPMYGAGRSMQDMLESGGGLPLVVRVSLTSQFRVVWNLIKLQFRQQVHCIVLLHNAYDKQNRTQVYNSTCTLTPSS